MTLPKIAVLIAVTLVIVLLGALAWLWHRRSDARQAKKTVDHSSTANKEQPIDHDVHAENMQAWRALGISYADVVRLRETFRNLTVDVLLRDTVGNNRILREKGFKFEFTAARMLQAMLTFHQLKEQGNPNVTLLQVMIWLQAELLIRQEGRLKPKAVIDPMVHQARVQKLVAAAAVVVANRPIVLDQVDESAVHGGKTILAESVEALIEQEAVFRVRKALGLKPGDPWPADVDIEPMLQEQRGIAESAYNAKHPRSGNP